MKTALLTDQEDQTIVESSGMGSEKWHTLLRAVGPHLAGQGETPGFLSRIESVRVKTLTKETLGDVPLAGWRGLHQDSKQNCYTTSYLKQPWALIFDPCDLICEDTCVAWVFCWLPCWIALCPFTLTASLLGCLAGTGRDVYNFSKKGLMLPLDDSKGIPWEWFSKKPHQAPKIQVMQEENPHILEL
jgi:hypothetical protein